MICSKLVYYARIARENLMTIFPVSFVWHKFTMKFQSKTTTISRDVKNTAQNSLGARVPDTGLNKSFSALAKHLPQPWLEEC